MTKNEGHRPLDLDAAVARSKGSATGDQASATLQINRNADPKDQPEKIQRFLRSVQLGSPALAVLDDDLPEGAVAQVIRDPASATPRLVAVSKATLDDEVLAFALTVLRTSEINNPEISQKRVVTLWRDRRVRVETGDAMQTATFAFEYLTPGRHANTDRIFALADAQDRQVIPGLGTARVIPAKRR